MRRIAPLLLLSACGGIAVIDASGGAGAAGGAAGSAGSAGAAGGGATPGPYDAYCESAATCEYWGGLPPIDVDACKAAAACDGLLQHHPGGDLFDCLLTCIADSCLLDVYWDAGYPITEVGEAFQQTCGQATIDGCGVFEDLCEGATLFTDEALLQMLACYDLPTCEQTEACVLAIYSPCVAWVYSASQAP